MRRRLRTEKETRQSCCFSGSVPEGESFIYSSEEVYPVHSVLKSEVPAGLELSCQYCTEKIAKFARTGTTSREFRGKPLSK